MKDFFSLITLTKMLALVALMVGCEGQPEKVPDQYVPVKDMTPILRDLYLAHAVATTQFAQDTLAQDSVYHTRYRLILEKNGLEHRELQSSLRYYMRHPQFIKKAQGEVLGHLKEMQTRLKAREAVSD